MIVGKSHSEPELENDTLILAHAKCIPRKIIFHTAIGKTCYMYLVTCDVSLGKNSHHISPTTIRDPNLKRVEQSKIR